jgi:hypothetical protein
VNAAVKISLQRRNIPLDRQSIIAELEGERDRLNKAIAALKSNERQIKSIGKGQEWPASFSSGPEEDFGGAKGALGRD